METLSAMLFELLLFIPEIRTQVYKPLLQIFTAATIFDDVFDQFFLPCLSERKSV